MTKISGSHSFLTSLLAGNFQDVYHPLGMCTPVIDGQIRNDSAVHLSQSTSAFRQFRANDPNNKDDALEMPSLAPQQ
jgi:hypothetical protein